jgi:hypothetical protein
MGGFGGLRWQPTFFFFFFFWFFFFFFFSPTLLSLGHFADEARDPYAEGHGRISFPPEHARFMRHRLGCVFCDSSDGSVLGVS